MMMTIKTKAAIESALADQRLQKNSRNFILREFLLPFYPNVRKVI